MKEKRNQSRRATPWDDKNNRTPFEEFIMGCTRDNYDKKHIAPGDEREIALLNSFAPKCCQKYGSVQTIRYGKTNAGLIRFRSSHYIHLDGCCEGRIRFHESSQY